ncbi:MAG: hypothetical protein ACM30I_16065 [Gemmatimonas sp.]
MKMQWTNSAIAIAVALLGTLAVARCAPDGPAEAGLPDPASENTQSIPYEGWFKDRPQ